MSEISKFGCEIEVEKVFDPGTVIYFPEVLIHNTAQRRKGRSTQQKMDNLFWPDENSHEQCFAAH